jgi:hypothetical protein
MVSIRNYVTAIEDKVTAQICVAERRGYVVRNASLGDFVVVRTCTYTNLDCTAHYPPRLYGIAYCS